MADSPLGDGELQGTAKVIAMLLGAGGLLKVTVALVSNVWDRWKKRDEHEYAARDRLEAVGWEQFREEKKITNELRIENRKLVEQLFAEQRAKELQAREIERFKEENAELIVEIERLRMILHRDNQPNPKQLGPAE
jgi:hypothetical protein